MGYTVVEPKGSDERQARPEPKEMVGSTDLRAFILENGPIAGSFSINGVRFTDFKAHSPGDVVRQINDKNGGVFAELDDGYHLVLVSPSGADIVVGDGSAYDAYREQATNDQVDDPAREYYRMMLQREKKDRKGVVEALGLEANDEAAFGVGEGGDWKPGRTAEDRQKLREKSMADADAKGIVWDGRTPFGGDSAADEYLRSLNQDKFGGGTSQMNRGPSDVISNNPSNPGNVSNATPGAGTQPGQGSDQRGLAPAQNNQPASSTNPGVENMPDGAQR